MCDKRKCGICGDKITEARPRRTEAPGKFATGTITGQYQSGQTIKVKYQVTVPHGGYFITRLCKNNNFKKDPDQGCFEKYESQLMNF